MPPPADELDLLRLAVHAQLADYVTHPQLYPYRRAAVIHASGLQLGVDPARLRELLEPCRPVGLGPTAGGAR